MLQRFVIPVSLGSKRSRRDTERKLVPLGGGGPPHSFSGDDGPSSSMPRQPWTFENGPNQIQFRELIYLESSILRDPVHEKIGTYI